MNITVLPSLLAADFGNLREGARLAEENGADFLHLDIMDGHLVPNLSFGPAVVKMAKLDRLMGYAHHLGTAGE